MVSAEEIAWKHVRAGYDAALSVGGLKPDTRVMLEYCCTCADVAAGRLDRLERELKDITSEIAVVARLVDHCGPDGMGGVER